MSKKYMGQIMAECDCPRMKECEEAGECLAEHRRNIDHKFDNFMRLEEERWFILWEKAGMPK